MRVAESVEILLGFEGMGSRLYLGAFSRMFNERAAWAATYFAEHGRNRRPPRDLINAVLSYPLQSARTRVHRGGHAGGIRPVRWVPAQAAPRKAVTRARSHGGIPPVWGPTRYESRSSTRANCLRITSTAARAA